MKLRKRCIYAGFRVFALSKIDKFVIILMIFKRMFTNIHVLHFMSNGQRKKFDFCQLSAWLTFPDFARTTSARAREGRGVGAVDVVD